MDIPNLAATRPYRHETITLLHEAFEAFWHKDFLKAWKISVLISASPIHVELRPGGCAPEVFEALRGEMQWAMDEITNSSRGALIIRENGRRPGDIEVGVSPLDWTIQGEGTSVYGRSLSLLPSDMAGLSIHGRVSISRHFLAVHWRERGELRRVCLQHLGEALGLMPMDVASCWCGETSLLHVRQVQALCALNDVRDFFERQPLVQPYMSHRLWPRPSTLLPSHAICSQTTNRSEMGI